MDLNDQMMFAYLIQMYESADVIKNEPTKIIAINDKIAPIGISLKIPNNCVSGGILKICLDCLPISIPVIPKV